MVFVHARRVCSLSPDVHSFNVLHVAHMVHVRMQILHRLFVHISSHRAPLLVSQHAVFDLRESPYLLLTCFLLKHDRLQLNHILG